MTRRSRPSWISHAPVRPDSLFGLLKRQGWKVHPDPLDGREKPGYSGGHIVNANGSHRPFAIDAVQVDLGREFRERDARSKTAGQLAAAIHQHATSRLRVAAPR